jgi:thiamine-phosphate diphosphorylase
MLPRLHAITDAHVLGPDFLAVSRRLSELGPRIAIHLRDRTATGRRLAELASALAAVLAGSGTGLIVNARPDIAAAVEAQGVQLGTGDLSVADARTLLPEGWIGRSVHGAGEGLAAIREGADYLVAGTIFASASHAGVEPAGTSLLSDLVAAGIPVIAIGGITPERAGLVHATGAHGVAAIRGIWDAADPLEAARQMLAPWDTAAA